MLGQWRPIRKPSNQLLPHPSQRSPQRIDRADVANSNPPALDRTITAAPLSTPHDVVVSQLLGRRASTSQESLVTPDPARHTLPKISIDGTASSLYHSDETPPPSQARSGLRSASASPLSAQPEHVPIYDPFTGALAGVMTPPVHDPEGGQAMSDTDFDQTRDELWVHLARIRELQSEIAGMHLQMEGVGSSDARSARRAAGATRRATEEWDDPGEAEERSKAMRDAEFATLAETFRGRRVVIDGIMNKLDDLSQALTTFHALPTPVMEFSNSRSNTKDSGSRDGPRDMSVPITNPVEGAAMTILRDDSELEPVLPESPASGAPHFDT
ncbi:hypothetical protein C8Q72DRAFT_806972 [Fomitopsis betulina]|nr:hypothetical protein C8Q72DRAFT_806972 [Fomitopsis betulina]